MKERGIMSNRLSSAVLTVVLILLGFAEQGMGQEAGEPFNFRRGQAVYINVSHRLHNAAALGRGIDYTFTNDLNYEASLRKKFEERQVFKVVEKLSEADFVFLVHVDGSSAEGFAVSPQTYTKYKEKQDVDALREAAFGRYLVGPYTFSGRGKVARALSDKFHIKAVP